MSYLSNYYKSDIAPALMKKYNYNSPMQIPRLDKVVINVGAGDAKENPKVIDNIITELSAITGQKAVPTIAKKSVSNFKLRAGSKIGAKVTLRGERMYEFVYKLFNLALPKVRDFKGINPNSFDGRGNYSLGLKEQLIFPKLNTIRLTKSEVWILCS
jgi:large subunit ribosomal protein L5